MIKPEKIGLEIAIKNWQQKRLPTKFKTLKEKKVLPIYKIKFSSRIQGKLFRVLSRYDFVNFINLHFFKKETGHLGTYQKTIPVDEIVFATGKVADFLIKEERIEQNAIEVLTSKGVAYVFWRDLLELDPIVD